MRPALFLLLVVGVFWELASSLEWLAPSLFASPSLIFEALRNEPQRWIQAFLETSLHSLIGFTLSTAGGFLLAVILVLIPRLKRAVLPFAVFFQTVPIVAIAPLLVIYFGFGSPTVVASSFFVSFFPVLASSLMGLENVSPEKRDLFATLGASRSQTLWKLQVPHVFSSLYSGLQVAGGLAIVGTVAGEFVAGTGLGSVIDTAKSSQRVDQVFASFLLLAFLGLIFLFSLKLIFRKINSIRPFVRGLEKERVS